MGIKVPKTKNKFRPQNLAKHQGSMYMYVTHTAAMESTAKLSIENNCLVLCSVALLLCIGATSVFHHHIKSYQLNKITTP